MRITEKSLKIAFKNIKFFAVSKSIYIREESFLKIAFKKCGKFSDLCIYICERKIFDRRCYERNEQFFCLSS